MSRANESSETTDARLLDAVFDNTHVMIAVLDPEMNFIRVNRAYAAIEDKQPADFVGKNHFELYPDAENEAIFRHAAQTGEPVSYQAKPFSYEHNPERGVSHWDWTLTPIKDDLGRVTSLVLSLLDVTERIHAMEALNKGKQNLHALNESLKQRARLHANELASFNTFTEAVLDTVGSLVIVLDKEGRIVRFNQACEKITGYKTQEVLGRQLWDFLLIPEERETVKAVFQDLRTGHFPSTHENFWLTKDGRQRWIRWNNSAMVDANGEVDYVIGTGVDTTERRQAEAGLRQSEQQFRLLAENINEMFWLASPDRKIMYYISPAFEKIWGRPVGDMYANPMVFLETSPEEDRARILSLHTEQHQGRFQDQYELEFRIYRPDGEMRWIASRYGPVRDENGEVFRVAGISVDVTERKLAEQERLRLERRQRDALVREVHHRIKNNLQGVMGLLRQHSAKQPHLSNAMETAITQVGTMALVHGLQSSDRGERILLGDLCQAIATSIMGSTGVTFTRHFRARFAIAVDEAVPLALVLNELMFNAVKHSPATQDKVITVDIEAGEESAIVRLRNPGTHLPEGLDVMRGTGLGTGLTLARTLLPKCASVALHVDSGWIETEISLGAPVIEAMEDMPAAD
jgi:PAS domain S-box-containing protein